MELLLPTAQQLLIMFLYLVIGYLLFRHKILSALGSKELAGFMIKLVIPAVLIKSFCVETSAQRRWDLAISLILSVLLILLAILIARLLFPKQPIEHFGAAFSNAGFIGIPLVSAVLGTDAVFYIAPFILLLNLLQWTYGVCVLRGEKLRFTFSALFLNPISIGSLIGLLLFLAGLGTHLPTAVQSVLNGIGALNTPLAMIILGIYFAQEDLRTLFTVPAVYRLCAVRLLLVPIASLALLWLIPAHAELRLALLIAASAPIGANVAVYAQIHGGDYAYASKTVVLSTLFSLITLPIITTLASNLL